MTLALLDIHTPSASFSIVHSLAQESLSDLYNKLSRKSDVADHGQVGPGWLKYEYNDSVWNLDDESDYAIFTWRRQQDDDMSQLHDSSAELDMVSIASSSRHIDTSHSWHSKRHVTTTTTTTRLKTPTLHLHNPKKPLPSPPEYCNPSYYIFRTPAPAAVGTQHDGDSQSIRQGSTRSPVPSTKSKKGKVIVGLEDDSSGDDGVPKFKKQFNRFHEENGVRTVIGHIGSARNVRMLLKPSYRHVYISRKFAIKHSFLPTDAAPGNYGYGGLITIGKWPITLVLSASQPLPTMSQTVAHHHYHHDHLSTFSLHNSSPKQLATSRIPRSSPSDSTTLVANGSVLKGSRRTKQLGNNTSSPPPPNELTASKPENKTVVMDVYLSEEPHFDVVLGRSFFEKRQIKLSSIDLTDVVCLDTGEKIECELVILKDGRGEIVTVT